MPLATYEDLIAAVKAYESDDGAAVVQRLEDCILLAEQRIFLGGGRYGDPFFTAPLRVRSMERTTVVLMSQSIESGTTSGSANAQVTAVSIPVVRGTTACFVAGLSNTGPMTLNGVAVRKGRMKDPLEADDVQAGSTYNVYHDGSVFLLMDTEGSAPLPDDYLGVRAAYSENLDRVLTFEGSATASWHRDRKRIGVPHCFAVQGNEFAISPLPYDGLKIRLDYYAKPAALAKSVNDIFREAPAIYLFATLFELANFLPSPERAAMYFAQFRNAIEGYAMSQRDEESTHGTIKVRLRSGL